MSKRCCGIKIIAQTVRPFERCTASTVKDTDYCNAHLKQAERMDVLRGLLPPDWEARQDTLARGEKPTASGKKPTLAELLASKPHNY